MVNPMFTVSRDSIPNLIYPNTPQRQPSRSRRTIKSTTRRLAAYRDRFADAGEFTFFIIGDFKPAELKPLVAQYLERSQILGATKRRTTTKQST